jgi:hypothetical protein
VGRPARQATLRKQRRVFCGLSGPAATHSALPQKRLGARLLRASAETILSSLGFNVRNQVSQPRLQTSPPREGGGRFSGREDGRSDGVWIALKEETDAPRRRGSRCSPLSVSRRSPLSGVQITRHCTFLSTVARIPEAATDHDMFGRLHSTLRPTARIRLRMVGAPPLLRGPLRERPGDRKDRKGSTQRERLEPRAKSPRIPGQSSR